MHRTKVTFIHDLPNWPNRVGQTSLSDITITYTPLYTVASSVYLYGFTTAQGYTFTAIFSGLALLTNSDTLDQFPLSVWRFD